MNQTSPHTFRRKLFRIFLPLLVAGLSGICAGQTGADSSMAFLRSQYDDGKYSNVEFEARRLLERKDMGDSLRVQVEQQLAFALVAQGQQNAAVEHFSTIFTLSSSFDLDPVLTSPKIMIAFNEAKRKSFLRRTPVGAGNQPVPAVRHATWRTLVFPGWEQWHQGRSTAGIVFAGAGTLALASLVYCDFQRRETRRDYLDASTSNLAAARYADYNRYYKAEIYSAVAVAVVYVASQLDVILTPPDRIIIAADTDGLSLRIRW